MGNKSVAFTLAVLLIAAFSASALDRSPREQKIANLCRKAGRPVAAVPGLRAADIKRWFRVGEIKPYRDPRTGEFFDRAEVTVYESFQVLATLDKKGRVTDLFPVAEEEVKNPAWLGSDPKNFTGKLEDWMSRRGPGYDRVKLLYKEVRTEADTSTYWLRALGEYDIEVILEKDTDRPVYYSNDMAVSGLVGGAPPDDEKIESSKEGWAASMKELGLAPDSAKIEEAVVSTFRAPGAGTVHAVELKLGPVEGDETGAWHGLCLLNPRSGALIEFSYEWSPAEVPADQAPPD